MEFSPLLKNLIDGLRCLPGVGPKTAQRMAFNLLEHNRDAGKQLANILNDAIDHIGRCNTCRTLTESDICSICSNSKRDQHKLCIVESPSDVYALEQSTSYKGLYFVLMGHLSPIDGIGPNDLGLDRLQERLKQNTINEVILATNPTIEGEATAHYVAEIIHAQGIVATRLAHGIPIGGELEYVDGGTLLHAFNGRLEF